MIRRLLAIAILFLALNTVDAANNRADLASDLKLFADDRCTTLKSGVSAGRFRSDAFKDLARRILDKSYNPAYLAAEYEAYPTPDVIGKTLRLGDGFSKYENMTGVYLDEGEHIIVVGKTHKREISLLLPHLTRKPAPGVKPTKDPNGWGLHKVEVPLKEGINIVKVDKPTNAYISYFAEDYDKAPKIGVHFVTGKVNGYFDITRGDDNAAWDKLLDQAVSPMMDARGKYIQVVYPVEFFKKYTSGKGVELINAYDRLIGIQYEMMGLYKYNKVPKNRVLSRVNFNYYMFRDKDGVAYLGDNGTMRMVADPEAVVKGDACWGFSHEVGHVMQTRPLKWGGMAEVSNNLYSLQATTLMGNESRVKKQNNFAKAREEVIGKNISYLHSQDLFNRLIPFWQLHLYFTKNGHPDFYGDVMEYLRTETEIYNGDDTIKYQFDFIKACCLVTKTDLTDFFEKWGFFWTGEIELKDYGNYHFKITKKMVNDTKKWIRGQRFPKPAADITLIDE